MLGRFKFVITKDNVLHIGCAKTDYHQDIANSQPARAAGYLLYDDGWVPNGRSVGYGISFNEKDDADIQRTLQKETYNSIQAKMDSENRVHLPLI